MQISKIQMALAFPDKTDMQIFLECENNSEYTCRFDIL